MSQQVQIQEILKGCLFHQTVQQAEAMLAQAVKSPTFLESLLGLIFQGIEEESLLVMALTALKNFLGTYYNSNVTPLPEQQRKLARDTCQNLYFKICHSNVGINLYKEILYILVAVSYPWPGLDLVNTSLVQPNAYIFGQIGRVYQYMMDEDRRPILEKTVDDYYPMIQKLVQQILEVYNQDTSKLLNEYLSMLEYNICIHLPSYLRNMQNLGRWMQYLKLILDAPLAPELKEEPNNTFTRNKIIASKVLFLIVSNHCNSNSDGADWPGWAKGLVSQYIPGLFQMILNMIFSLKATLNTEVLSNALKMVYFGLKNENIREYLLPHADTIFFQEMLPLIDISDEDINLFQNDPIEFIRKEQDCTANPIKRDAMDVVEVLIYLSHNGKSFLIKFIEYAAVALPDLAVSMRRKVTIFQLISKLKTEILKNEYLRGSFGNFMIKYFLPFLSNDNPILVSACCELLEKYLVSITLETNVVQPLIAKLYDCLNHKYTVVRFKSILAFTSLIDDGRAVELVRPHFDTILKIYISLIDQIDHESLLKSLEKIVKHFGQEILSYAPQLTKHLLSLFYKHISKDPEDIEEDENERDGVDGNASAALGTIREILDTILPPRIYYDLFPSLMELLLFIIDKKLDYMEETLTILAVALHKCQQIPDYVVCYLALRKLLEGQLHQSSLQCDSIETINSAKPVNLDQREPVLSCLKNLIVKMPREILFSYPLPKNPELILCLIQNKILSTDQLQRLDQSEISGNWGAILQSYSSVLYSLGTVQNNLPLIKEFPSTISFYPWLMTLENMDILVAIIKKVLNRFDEEEDSMGEESTLQALERYAKDEDEDEDYEIEDGVYIGEQQEYNYLYDSPYKVKNDLLIIKDKMSQMSPEIRERVLGALGKNEYAKLQRLFTEVRSS